MLELFLEDPRVRAVHVAHQGHRRRRGAVDGAGRVGSPAPSTCRCTTCTDPTEASVDVLGWTADGGPVALGVPGWNVRAYVLDGYLNPVPAGAPGELYLAGVQLADGYLHRHGLTAQTLRGQPVRGRRAHVPHRRRSCVGDGDGQLEYLGRTDDQIKLRGVRIEPGEIETVLAAHPVGVLGTGRRPRRPAGRLLPARRRRRDERAPTRCGRTRRRRCPSTWCRRRSSNSTAFPLTPSGKLDRKALPDTGTRRRTAGRPPETVAQQRLCELFSDVLGVDVTEHRRRLLHPRRALPAEHPVDQPGAGGAGCRAVHP